MRHPRELFEYDWKNLDEGETLRVPCSHWKCEGKNAALTITRVIGGAIYNCYRCGSSGYPGFISDSGSSPDHALRRIKQLKGERRAFKPENCVIRLPRDFVPMVTQDKSIPPHAYAWLYKYELDEDDIYNYNIGYSFKLSRVIIPIYKDNKLIAWIGRDIYYKRNKELFKENKIKNKPLKYYTEYLNKNKLYFKILNNNNNNIIIVEDILSAIKVHNKFKYNIIALLNSSIHKQLVTDLELFNYNTIYLWLDPDAHIRAIQGAFRLREQGLNVKVIRTDADPKDVPYKEMVL